MRCSKRLIIALHLLLATGAVSAQQLSLGNTPAVLTKSAVLELNSAKQGLLLPRLSDTVAINALNPPDGMLIYFIPTKQLFIRSNGYWNPLAFSTSLNNYVPANALITGATKTKITYDSKGLVTAGADATTSDIAEGGNLYFTNARVRNTDLTGLSTATATAVTATDNVLGGVGKLQAQINAINGAGYLTSETDPLAAKKTANLSDLANAGTARTNLGATTVGSNFFTLANPSAVAFPRINADNSVSALDAAAFRSAIGAGTGSGSVMSVSVVNTNGFTGSVATATSTPALTLSTTVNGLLKGNAATGVVSAAAAGTDYQAPIALPYATTRYWNGYGNFVGLNSDSVAQGATNLFVTAAEKSAWNAKEGAIVAPYAANRYWNGYKQFVALNTDSVSEGGTNLFYTAARVRTTTLAGFTATNAAVTAADNVLGGMGKLQGQINALTGAGYLTGNQSISFTAGGDATGSASGTTSLSPSLTVTGLRGAALPSLATGLLRYNGSAWVFDNGAYLTSETSTLANVTGRGNATATGIQLTQNGNLSTSYSLYLKRAADASPLGNLIQAQNAAANTDLFKVDVNGNTTANSFVKSGGTAAQFLKADGSVDNNSYLTGNQTLTLSGDVTGSGTTAITTAIGANKVTLGHMAQVANGTFLGRTSAGSGNVEALTTAQAKTALGLTGNNSGDVSLSGQSYLSLSGQTLTANAVDLSGTHATGTLAAARFGALTGDVTNTAGSYATTIAAGAVTYGKMQNISATSRLLGRFSAGAGSPEEIVIGSGLSLSGNTLSATATTTNWNTLGNAGTAWATNFLGTTDNQSLRLRTANTQRMIVDSLGRVGIGITNPGNPLVIKDTMEIRRTGALSTLLFSNTAGSGDFRIGGDGGDIFWQGGGGRSLQTGAYWTMILAGDRQTTGFPAFQNGVGGTGVLIPAQRTGSVPLAVQAIAGQTANLMEWRNPTGSLLGAFNSGGYLGIGSPTFDGTNPEKLLVNGGTTSSINLMKGIGSINNYLQFNIQNTSAGNAASTDIVATANNGSETSNYIDMGINGSGNAGGFFGNANDAYLYNNGQDLLIGTSTANKSLYLLTGGGDKTANTRLHINGDGSVGIGTTSFDPTKPEMLKVDADTSTYTPILATGNYPGYLQINVKNKNTGTQASSDVVATADNGTETTNYINMGINGSNYFYQAGNSLETGKANDGYLISSGNDFYLVNTNAAKDMIFLAGGTSPSHEAMRITAAERVGIGTSTPADRFHVMLPTGTGSTLTNVATVETNNTVASALSMPANFSLVRQVPSFSAGVTYTGPAVSFGFRTAGTQNNLAQIQTYSTPTVSRFSFITRTGMTNANPATGTLAENMFLEGNMLNVKNLQGGATSLSVDANGYIIRTASDARLKRNVQTIQSPLAKVLKLRGVTYNWIDTAAMGSRREMGFIAQELEQVVPEVVSSGGSYKSVNYPVLNALLTEAVKEQQTEIETLRRETKDLRQELEALRREMHSLLKTAGKAPAEKGGQ